MAEYIDRQALLAHIKDLPTWWADAGGYYGEAQKLPDGLFDPEDIIASIENFPSADVAPVEHGRWEYIPQTLNTLSQLRCPFCGWWSLDPSIDGAYNYCPNCGARMME